MLSEMQRSSAAGEGEHGCTAAEGILSRRERELVAQLHELLFPSPSPAPSGGASWSSSGTNALVLFDECPPVKAPDRRRKRVRDEQDEELGGGESAKPRCGNKTSRRKKQGRTTTLVTTVPDFDGYQWKKYGQKQIEAATYPRSYYRCTNSTDQGCPAKRTVQRNDDDDHAGEGGPKKYTVVYISEHTCKATEPVAPVILETTVRTTNPAADHNNTTPARATPAAAPAVAVAVPAESGSTATGTESPAISDITWSGDTKPTPSEHGDYSLVFAADDWDPTTAPVAAALFQEMNFTGPIRSPVHIAANGWIDDLLVNEPSVLNSCHLFGF